METEQKVKLNPKQEMFCQYYATEREFFGNGVQAYAEAYDIDLSEKKGYGTARANSSKLLTNTDILTRINELLDFDGFNDVAVDKQLKFVIAQNADFGAKVAAMREYNKLKQRIVDKSESLVTADVTSNGQTIGDPTLAAGFADYLKNQTKNS